MNRTFRLAAVLRAREAQEQVARAALARANGQVAEARAEADRRAAVLAARPAPGSGSAAAILATVTAGRALAAELALAERACSDARDAAQHRAGEWRTTAIRRRALERLAERHARAVRTAEERAAQRELDDRAGRPARSIRTTAPTQTLPARDLAVVVRDTPEAEQQLQDHRGGAR